MINMKKDSQCLNIKWRCIGTKKKMDEKKKMKGQGKSDKNKK